MSSIMNPETVPPPKPASSEPAAAAAAALRFGTPASISPEAASKLGAIYALSSRRPPASRPMSVGDWDREREALDKRMTPVSDALVAELGVGWRNDQVGSVPVVRILPAAHRPPGRTLVYMHGGGFTRFSARSRLGLPALVAAATGDEVISVDYTVAPRGDWKLITDQVLSVWRELLAEGALPGSVGLFGDSAGASIAAGAVLKMRDQDLPLPGALYFMSPSCDLTYTGDSFLTLSKLDPVLDLEGSRWGADAYAEPQDQRHPYASPIYGDYSKPFPPTLIQGGTRELLLSSFVRQYQAIRAGGHEAVLDLYEGMPHVFQGSIPDTPEARTAIARGAAFLKQHLRA